MENDTDAPKTQPVDRQRRAYFISSVVGFCLVTAAAFTSAVAWVGVATTYLPIVELFISGVLGLAMATTLAYVGGSVVDYNGGIGNMFSRGPSRDNRVYPEAKG